MVEGFPAATLGNYGIMALHPDDSIVAQLDLKLYAALTAFKGMRARTQLPEEGWAAIKHPSALPFVALRRGL